MQYRRSRSSSRYAARQRSVLADSGGYRRPTISAPTYSGSSSSGWSAPSSGGYRRPSTTGGGYTSRSAGDVSISRTNSAQALQQYRASQQPRRPPVESAARPDTVWGGGGYYPRRPSSYYPQSDYAGGLGSAAFWAMLGALSASDRTAYFQRSQTDPAYQQWHQQAGRDPTTAARLAALGDQATTASGGAGTTAAAAPGGSGIVWVVLFIGAAGFLLLWLARRRAATSSAGAATPPGLAGSAPRAFGSARPSRSTLPRSCSPRARPRFSRRRGAA